MSAPAWRQHPNPGDMALCRACPHRRQDERKDYRCAQTRHHGFTLPPYTEVKRDGTEYCGYWPPKQETADLTPNLFEGVTA